MRSTKMTGGTGSVAAGALAAARPRPRPRSAQELFVLFAPALAVFAITVFARALMVDGDAFWHIAAGEWMLDHRQVLNEDPFSFTFAGAPWRAHEWASELLLAATYRTAGWHGLYLLVGLAFASTAFLLARPLLDRLDPVPALYLTLFALADIKGWVMLRPHVFVMPILALFAAELLAARSERRAPHWFLLPLMVIWANLHPSFLLGAALILVFALEAILEAKGEARLHAATIWGGAFLGALLAALVNPAGFSGLIFPIVFSATATTAMIPEWQSMTFNALGPVEISLLAGLGAVLFLGVRVPVLRLLLLLGLLHMTLTHQRFVIALAIVGPMILAEPIANALKAKGWIATAKSAAFNPLPATAGAVLLAFLIAAASFTVPRTIQDADISPVTALAHVPKTIAAKPVFNDWLWGGYLILTGLKPFIDGRAELYGHDFIFNYMQMVRPNRSALEETFAKHGIVWTLLPPNNRANVVLDLLPAWCTLYADPFAVVHVRKDALAATDARCQPGPSADVP